MSEWNIYRARAAALSRSRRPDDPELLAAKRALLTARLPDHVQAAIDEAPPLTDEQRAKLAALFGPNGPDRRLPSSAITC